MLCNKCGDDRDMHHEVVAVLNDKTPAACRIADGAPGSAMRAQLPHKLSVEEEAAGGRCYCRLVECACQRPGCDCDGFVPPGDAAEYPEYHGARFKYNCTGDVVET